MWLVVLHCGVTPERTLLTQVSLARKIRLVRLLHDSCLHIRFLKESTDSMKLDLTTSLVF